MSARRFIAVRIIGCLAFAVIGYLMFAVANARARSCHPLYCCAADCQIRCCNVTPRVRHRSDDPGNDDSYLR